MARRQFDAILCNWPLLGLVIIPASVLTNDFQSFSILQVIIAAVFGGGWLVALIFAFFRLAHQNWESKRVVLWVLGLLWFSVISLPWLYWKYLRKETLQSGPP